MLMLSYPLYHFRQSWKTVCRCIERNTFTEHHIVPIRRFLWSHYSVLCLQTEISLAFPPISKKKYLPHSLSVSWFRFSLWCTAASFCFSAPTRCIIVTFSVTISSYFGNQATVKDCTTSLKLVHTKKCFRCKKMVKYFCVVVILHIYYHLG